MAHQRLPRTSAVGCFKTIYQRLTIVAKLSILDVKGWPGHVSGEGTINKTSKKISLKKILFYVNTIPKPKPFLCHQSEWNIVRKICWKLKNKSNDNDRIAPYAGLCWLHLILVRQLNMWKPYSES